MPLVKKESLMETKNSEEKKTTFYFKGKDLYRVDLDTLNHLWPIINKEALEAFQSKADYLVLPELHQLEMALILIRQGYMNLSIDEESERLSIILEVCGYLRALSSQ